MLRGHPIAAARLHRPCCATLLAATQGQVADHTADHALYHALEPHCDCQCQGKRRVPSTACRRKGSRACRGRARGSWQAGWSATASLPGGPKAFGFAHTGSWQCGGNVGRAILVAVLDSTRNFRARRHDVQQNSLRRASSWHPNKRRSKCSATTSAGQCFDILFSHPKRNHHHDHPRQQLAPSYQTTTSITDSDVLLLVPPAALYAAAEADTSNTPVHGSRNDSWMWRRRLRPHQLAAVSIIKRVPACLLDGRGGREPRPPYPQTTYHQVPPHLSNEHRTYLPYVSHPALTGQDSCWHHSRQL